MRFLSLFRDFLGLGFLGSSLFRFFGEVLLKSLLSFMLVFFSFLEGSDGLLESTLVVGVGLGMSFFDGMLESFSSFVDSLSSLSDGFGVLTMGFLVTHSVLHSSLGSVLLSLQGSLGFGDGRGDTLFGLLEFFFDVLGRLLNGFVNASEFVSEHVIVSTSHLESVLGFHETLLLDDEGFRSLVVEFLGSGELCVDNLEGGLAFSDLRR